MIKIKYILFVFGWTLLGCASSESENQKSSKHDYTQELEALKVAYTKSQSENEDLKQQLKKVNQELEQKSAYDSYTLTETMEYARKGFLNLEYIIGDVFDDMNWKNIEDEPYFLWDLSSIVNENRFKDLKAIYDGKVHENYKKNNPIGTHFFKHFAWKKLDKSPEHLKQIIKEEHIDYLAELFTTDGLYTEHGVNKTVDALLIAYKEIGDNETLLNTLLNRADSTSAMWDSYYNTHVISQDVRNLIGGKQILNDFVDEQTRLNWIYSFWARRYKEGNAQYVYTLIETFKAKVTELIGEEELY